MIRLYPEQLNAQLQEGLRSCYHLYGNEPLLLEESQDAIRHLASQQGFSEVFAFELNQQTDWDVIFSECQALSLFSSRKIFILQFPENGINAALAEQLTKLSTLLNPDILLILRGPRPTKAQENSEWFKALSNNSVYVSCLTPEQAHLPRWVAQRAKSLKLVIDDAAIQLMCYCYEGNLLALSQALERLSLLYPDGKLTLPRVEHAVNDAAHFTPYHWLDAIMAGKTKRALHILHQLRLEDTESLILIRTLQRELLQLLHLQRQMQQTPLRTLFDRQKVWQNRRPLLTQALQRLTASQLTQAVALLTQLELTIKQDFGQSIWDGLESLMMLLCGKPLPEARLDV
ncbi:DNA polymerase III subunit delta [Budvicia aquatica]|uniref:DNA polymerase III subunit delta n=1 Tax=Budvicia aquatica TaxID=82979 RepID=A0A2C6DNF0_9GAMM|nr:DNA polymerase III subunit delta [Budvicia aquatica]MBP9641977.1 DNA polymerase III subunit delta [Budvicia sp.]PHI30223.1 DNA polymerase III subunit delta [Budvicia aquatica]GKX53258.1 DNA polymerase III subunit delta [Budvicia aquatica]VFS49279.1 DNA polymerase III subunit delta [Budvicia aquatica]